MPGKNIGDYRNPKLSNARLYAQLTGETGYQHLGNVAKYKASPEIERAQHLAAQKGYRSTSLSLVTKSDWFWDFTLTEQSPLLQRLLWLATPGADATQSVATSQTTTISNAQPGYTYPLGKYCLSNVVVTVASATKTLGVDYALDSGAGMLTVLRTGTIAAGATVDVSFDCASVVQETYTAGAKLIFTGAFLIHEFDQHSPVPLEEWVIAKGQIYVTEPGEHDGTKPSEAVVRVLAIEPPTSKRRVDS